MKKILLIMALCLTAFFSKASDCPTSVTFDNYTKQFTFHFSTMPSGYSSFTHLRIKVKSGKGAGNTYNINIISMTSNTIVIGDGSGVIDGTTITDVIDYHDKDHNGPTCTTDIALPVKLISFKYINGVFTWATATEINNNMFILQTSTDTKIWTDKETTYSLSSNGNSSVILNYSVKIPIAENYWRLKQIDFNGEFEYSDIIHINKTETNPIIINPIGIVVDAPESGIYFIYSNNTWSKIYVQK